MLHLRIVSVLLLLFLAAPAAGADDIRTSDTWIHATLVTTYTLNDHLSGLDIQIEVDDGAVTLTGEVPSGVDRDLAGEIAHGVEGVRSVDNQLTLTDEEPPEEDSAFMRGVQDATLTARIRSRLLWNEHTRGQGIRVEAADGTVTLSGEVNDAEVRELAGQITRNTRGVAELHNELEVREARDDDEKGAVDQMREHSDAVGQAASDTWITSRAKTSLLFTEGVPGRRIQVSTEEGIVTLEGEVDSTDQAERAVQTVTEIAGVQAVRNQLQVRGESQQ